MKYLDFKNQYNKYPYFYSHSLVSTGELLPGIRKQLHDWTKRGLVIQLKKGLYVLNNNDLVIPLEEEVISSVLVSPSYISLEYALAYYGLIPEKVGTLTAVTTKKTQIYSNQTGQYIYRNIKSACFNGFVEKQSVSGFSYYIAIPEKALVDFCYYNCRILKQADLEIFEHSYRIQNTEDIDIKLLRSYTEQAAMPQLSKVVDKLIKYIKKDDYKKI